MRYLTRILLCFLIVHVFFKARAQYNGEDLTLRKGEILQVKTDSLLIGNLTMNDSSKIILTVISENNYLKINRLTFGVNCHLLCNGIKGSDGQNAREVVTPSGPCKSGLNGRPGQNGFDGKAGRHDHL